MDVAGDSTAKQACLLACLLAYLVPGAIALSLYRTRNPNGLRPLPPKRNSSRCERQRERRRDATRRTEQNFHV